jgi:uncharacterized Zn-finger protein
MFLTGALLLAAMPVLAASNPAPSVTIIQPAAGQEVTTGDIHVAVKPSDFTLECKDVGKPTVPGQGHIHVMLDGMTMAQLTNLYCSDTFSIAGAGIKPGKHELAVVLAGDAHEMVGKPAMVSFDYEPASTGSLPAGDADAKPTLKIVSPVDGATVGRKFSIQVAVSDFTLSCDAEGKPDRPGVGHLHVFVKQSGVTDVAPMSGHENEMMSGGGMSGGTTGHMSGGGMSMVGMIGMPCTKTVPIDLSSWRSGKAMIDIMLANNDHMPTMGAGTSASITVDLK